MSPTTDVATAQRLAEEFCRVLRRWLTPADPTDIARRNRTHVFGVRATHDFCDANMVMAEAFARILAREPDPGSDADAAVWNAAWKITGINGFAPRNVADYFLTALGEDHGDESLRDLPMQSPCGEECVKAIDAATDHIAHMRAALGNECEPLRCDTIEMVRQVVSVYWRG